MSRGGVKPDRGQITSPVILLHERNPNSVIEVTLTLETECFEGTLILIMAQFCGEGSDFCQYGKNEQRPSVMLQDSVTGYKNSA